MAGHPGNEVVRFHYAYVFQVGRGKMRQSYYWYIPIVIIILSSYVVGAILSFGVQFFEVFKGIQDPKARLVLTLFGMGILGATMYCSRWWCVDMECSIKDSSLSPHMYDCVGYLTVIFGGGITGVLLYFTVKLGIILTVTSPKTVELRTPASLIVAFCGGLFHFRVRAMLADMVKKIAPVQQDQEKLTEEI